MVQPLRHPVLPLHALREDSERRGGTGRGKQEEEAGKQEEEAEKSSKVWVTPLCVRVGEG